MKKIKTAAAVMALSMSLAGAAMSVHAHDGNTAIGGAVPVQTTEENQGDNSAENPEKAENEEPRNNEEVADAEMQKSGEAKESRRSDDSKPSNLLSIIALIIGLGGVGLGVLNLSNIKKLDEKIGKQKDGIKKKFSETDSLLEVIQHELPVANLKLGRCQEDILSLREVLASLKSAFQAGMTQHPAPNFDQSPYRPQGASAQAHQPAKETIKLYCGVPRGGVFTNPSKSPSMQTLYVITDNGGSTASYSFRDDRDSAMVAARSTSDFVDPGCIISGLQNSSFTKVRTVTPGTVRKASNGWVIETKAVVELV